MKKIRLESGLNIEVHDEVTNDYRFFKSLAEVNNDGNIFALYQALGRLWILRNRKSSKSILRRTAWSR